MLPTLPFAAFSHEHGLWITARVCTSYSKQSSGGVLGCAAHEDGCRDGHAALACRPKGCACQGSRSGFWKGIWQHHCMVLGSCIGLHSQACTSGWQLL